MIRKPTIKPPQARYVHVRLLLSITLILASCNKNADNAAPDQAAAQPVAAVASEALRPYTYSDGPYAYVALSAANRYSGNISMARLDVDNAGEMLSALRSGPLSDATRFPGSVPKRKAEIYNRWGDLVEEIQIVTAGFPAAWLSLSNIGHSETPLPGYATGYKYKQPYSHPFWRVFENRENGSAQCSSGGLVVWSGALEIEGAPGSEERSVTWSGCTLAGAVIEGSARMRADPLASGGYAYTVACDDLQFSFEEDHYVVVGVDAWPNGVGCDIAKPHHSYLLVEARNAGASFFVENLATSIIGHHADSRICSADGIFANHWQGRVIHSEHGAIEAWTPSHLAHLSTSEFYDRYAEPYTQSGITGQLVLSGDLNSQVILIYRNGGRFDDVIGADEYVVAQRETAYIEVHPGDRTPTVFQFTMQDQWLGVTGDLADSDGDGSPNAWEQLHGLDSADGSDAVLDIDGDGATAAEESMRATSPNEFDLLTASADEQLELVVNDSPNYLLEESEHNFVAPVYRDDLRDIVSVYIPPRDQEFYPTTHRFTLSIDGEPRFVAAIPLLDQLPFGGYARPEACELSLDARSIICDLPAERQCSGFSIRGGYYACLDGGLDWRRFAIVDTKGTPYTLTGTLHPGAFDLNPANDVVVIQR